MFENQQKPLSIANQKNLKRRDEEYSKKQNRDFCLDRIIFYVRIHNI